MHREEGAAYLISVLNQAHIISTDGHDEQNGLNIIEGMDPFLAF
jgi:hypothetical protein